MSNTLGADKEGLLADFVILSANPLKTDVSEIKDIAVVETIKEGKSIYQAQ